MITVGRICVKTAGRDAGRKCVVVESLDKNHVLIDGETRRRKCNIAHLEPLAEEIKIEAGASGDSLSKALHEVGIALRQTKAKSAATRPRRKRKQTKAPAAHVVTSAQGQKQKSAK